MFDVIDTYAVAVVAYKEAVNDPRGIFKEHRQLGPEEAVQQIAGAGFQRLPEFLLVKIIQQVAVLGRGAQPGDHFRRRHH